MRVLQVGSSLTGWAGIERYVVSLSDGLVARGHDVSVTCAPETMLSRKVHVPAIQIRVRHKLDMRGMAAYIRLFRQVDFDVVHVHFNADFQLVAWASRLTRSKPIVMTRHVALPWAWPKAKHYAYLYDRIIPVSEASRSRLLRSGVPAGKMTVAKAGAPSVDTVPDPSVVRRSLGIDDRFHVGFFGRLAPEKGVSVLLDAVPILGPEVGVSVFGDGPLRGEVEAAANRSPTLKYFGFREDVQACLAAMDAVVIPSTWEEAFPYSALEAMAVGRAIVASNIGGLPELVTEGKNGLLFAPGSAAGLAAAVSRLAADPSATQAMGAQGRQIQRDEYTIDKMAERIESVYRSLLWK